MIIIDPLKLKLKDFLFEGSRFPLNLARQKYGSPDDLEKLLNELNRTELDDERKYIYIDLTPFERNEAFIIDLFFKLKSYDFYGFLPVFLALSYELSDIKKIAKKCTSGCLINFHENGLFDKEYFFSAKNDYLEELIKNDFRIEKRKKKKLNEFRSQFSEYYLTKKIHHRGGILLPTASDTNTFCLGGKYYRVMQNNMLVSSYLDLKSLCKNINDLIDIAYEVVLYLNNYFIKNGEELEFDKIVVANNTSLVIGSLIQKIMEKEVIAIDKLGPIPTLKLESRNLKKQLTNKKVIVLEEVMSTGSEVDRIVMFLNHINSIVEKVVAIYNLDVGGPKVIDKKKVISLSSPKEDLKYEYRSK